MTPAAMGTYIGWRTPGSSVDVPEQTLVAVRVDWVVGKDKTGRHSLYLGNLAVQFVTIVMSLCSGASRDTGIRNRCPFLATS